MNRTRLKNYAPQARREFIQAMTDRAAYYGLTTTKIEPVVERGDVAVIAGREHPRTVAKKRSQLEARIARHGFEQTMEALAYTWFNRLVAIRFMELHGYLDHGYRVLSHPEGRPTPQILQHAEHVELPGLRREAVIDLKLAGNKEAELYRLLLTAQCNSLNTAMPFLFEKIDDETELLLPDNLLHSDSLVRKLVSEIAEEDWQEVEIIGWLYQFYISEKKDQVTGKVVASEDIPAATQLFTPNWIVKYLVQNTLGRQWLATYPQSALRQQMPYYIEPAVQTPEVQQQLKAITPTTLNPEELTLLDPACGSGHILVEAYDLFRAIYQERGYRAKDIPALILQKNLYGLEIDDRAAQLSAFALMMKARADDRRFFESEAKPNILAFEDSKGMNGSELTRALNSPINKHELPPSTYLIGEIEDARTPLFSKEALVERAYMSQTDMTALLALFEDAKTLGTLIQVPHDLGERLVDLEQRVDDVLARGDLSHAIVRIIKPLLNQVRFLTRRYDAVVANPPYMGSQGMNATLKTLARSYPMGRQDLFAMFMERCFGLLKAGGTNAQVNMQSWMFLSSYDELRRWLVETKLIRGLMQIGYNSFPELNSKVVQCVAWSAQNRSVDGYIGSYIDLNKGAQSADKQQRFLSITPRDVYCLDQRQFLNIPGATFVYWASKRVFAIFATFKKLQEVAELRSGISTGDNERFYRAWFEVDWRRTALAVPSSDSKKWFPIVRGGEFRRWFGNRESIINLKDDGVEIATSGNNFRLRDPAYYDKVGITWSRITSGALSFRVKTEDVNFGENSPCLFADSSNDELLAVLNSKVASHFVSLVSPTLSNQAMDIGKVPVVQCDSSVAKRIHSLLAIAKQDWDRYERSWEFQLFPMLAIGDAHGSGSVAECFATWLTQNREEIAEMKRLEEENNRFFIDAYGLQTELTPQVPVEQITLTVNPAYRYGCRLAEDEQWNRFRQDTMQELVSYAVGCAMGRYSLSHPGIMFAQSGNQGFDPAQYPTFQADDDGIIAATESDWGIRHDAANRVVEFVGVAWPREHLGENLTFIADGLGAIDGEQPRDTIRRYLATGFYKHHLSIYKKRPIYWLFSSGKQRAFQCLVYLHRYHEGTLARMRTEYVIPLQGQIASRIEQLEGDKAKAASTSQRRRLQKEQDDLTRQQSELLVFEEKLRHAADQKISLDLDDGVKVNYGKFGDLLADSKGITGGTDDE